MSGQRIALDADVVGAHVTRVRAVAGDVGDAHAAAAGLALGGGAFGLMCALLVPPAQAATDAALGAVEQARALVERSADQLAGVVTDFTGVEDAVCAQIDALSVAVREVR